MYAMRTALRAPPAARSFASPRSQIHISTSLSSERQPSPLLTPLKGRQLLEEPRTNKGSAFTREERERFALDAFLPYEVQDLSTQVKRARAQMLSRSEDVLKYSFLRSLRDQNQVLFYRTLQEDLKESLPIIYTPTVGDAIKQFSHIFRRPDGIFLSYPHFKEGGAGWMKKALTDHDQLTKEDVDLVVVTDGEGILGIGDWGVGGISICIGKSVIYTLGAGVDPNRILTVVLDAGTDNHGLANDPLYMGWRHSRVRGEQYVSPQRCLRCWSLAGPNHLLTDSFPIRTHLWTRSYTSPPRLSRMRCSILRISETRMRNACSLNSRMTTVSLTMTVRTFSQNSHPHHLNPLLRQFCFFPPPKSAVQGTGAVTLAALMSACNVTKSKLSDQRIIIQGAGTAGLGIASRVRDAMTKTDGISEEEANKRFFLIDRDGLLLESMGEKLRPGQAAFARPDSEVKDWPRKDADKEAIRLIDTVRQVKPTVLIGTSTQARSFDEEVIREMAKHTKRPIIFPLSNPTTLCEVDPADANEWSNGMALMATGSPFPPTHHPKTGKEYIVAEVSATAIPDFGFALTLLCLSAFTCRVASRRLGSATTPSFTPPSVWA